MSLGALISGDESVDFKDFCSKLDEFYSDINLPIIVALSGGGDSLALLHMTLRWARLHDTQRTVHAVTVDHGLRDESGDEAAKVSHLAQKLGAISHVLTWEHGQTARPRTAIQEKARIARYSLMGQFCRDRGALGLLLGHNEDDQAETIAMRLEGGASWRGLCGMTEQSYAPVWPQLRDVTLFRPLLAVSGQGLRQYCRANNLAFVDDPSNRNLAFERVSVRQAMQVAGSLKSEMLERGHLNHDKFVLERQQAREWIEEHVRLENGGALKAPIEINVYALYLALQAASGRPPPSWNKVETLHVGLKERGFLPKTIGGALISPDHKGQGLLISRDKGGVLGRAGQRAVSTDLHTDVPSVWDGRFEFQTSVEGLTVKPLWPELETLSRAQRDALKAYPLVIRSSLPAVFSAGSLVFAPHIDLDLTAGGIEWRDLTASRLGLKCS